MWAKKSSLGASIKKNQYTNRHAAMAGDSQMWGLKKLVTSIRTRSFLLFKLWSIRLARRSIDSNSIEISISRVGDCLIFL